MTSTFKRSCLPYPELKLKTFKENSYSITSDFFLIIIVSFLLKDTAAQSINHKLCHRSLCESTNDITLALS